VKSGKHEEDGCCRYQYGDMIRLNTDWYYKNGLPYKKGSCFKVYYQHFDWVVTDRGDFNIEDVELAKVYANAG